MTALARTRRGSVVHTSDCRYARTGTPWLWADTVTRAEVEHAVARYGLWACRHCRPLASPGHPEEPNP